MFLDWQNNKSVIKYEVLHRVQLTSQCYCQLKITGQFEHNIMGIPSKPTSCCFDPLQLDKMMHRFPDPWCWYLQPRIGFKWNLVQARVQSRILRCTWWRPGFRIFWWMVEDWFSWYCRLVSVSTTFFSLHQAPLYSRKPYS